jgi:rare lipoprotein A
MKRYVFKFCLFAAALLLLGGCSEVQLISHIAKNAMPPARGQGSFKVGNPYKVEGQTYYPEETYDYEETGIASWYGKEFEGRRTANGEIFDRRELTAAHRTLQMPSLVRVTNLDNGRSLVVRVNDRGPYRRGRVMDVSERAAELLGFKNNGTAKVKLQLLKEESLKIAAAAKAGQDTSGYELAMNQQAGMYRGTPQRYQLANVVTGGVPYDVAARGNTPGAPPSAVPPHGAPVPQVVTAYAPNDYTAIVPGHERNGNFYPDPIVTEMPVRPTGIYVQAGSFGVADNANRLAQSLQGVGRVEVHPALIGGRQFYRVRLGPVSSVDQADALLSRVVNAGNKSAIIVVE